MSDTTIYFSSSLYDDQFARTLAATYAGTADLGEAFAAARTIGKHADPQRWYDGWITLARAVEQQATAAADAGNAVSARNAYLRASEYYRQAFFFLRHRLDDKRLQDAYRDHVRTFAAAAPDLGIATGEAVEIPYQDTSLHGWFFTPTTRSTTHSASSDSAADGPVQSRPTVILPDGYDSTAEEMLSYAIGALERGYNVVAFDGPGQGRALYSQSLFMRPDFEAVLTPVIDWVLTRPEVDADRIALIGRSFAGYLAPRAAAFEHRIAALVCDPPDPNISSRIPKGLVGMVAAPVVTVKTKTSADKREFFGARMATHDVHTVEDYFATLRTFDMLDVADQITAPSLFVECEGDPLAGSEGSAAMASRMTAPTTNVRLSAASGAGGHCGGMGQKVWDAIVYDWLDATLSR